MLKEQGILSASKQPGSQNCSSKEIMQDSDIKESDTSKLKVTGTETSFVPVSESQTPSKEKHKESHPKEDSLQTLGDGQSEALAIPALKVLGQVATWTGNSACKQGEVGLSPTMFFEGVVGQIVSSDLEIHNEGSTTIFYRWQKLTLLKTFPHVPQKVHFYFNISSGAICPGETQRVEVIFKSDEPGLKTELWQLHTSPVLLQGASIQVRLSGVAFDQDENAPLRRFLEKKLDKVVVGKMCRSIVYKMVQRVHSPERPKSAAELYVPEEQQFLNKNPKLQYSYQPVEDLRRLWHALKQENSWDFSLDSLHEAVVSMPDEGATLGSPSKDEALALLNSVFLQLSRPPEIRPRLLTPAFIGKQLWRRMLDLLADEAMRLRSVFGLPEKDTWVSENDSQISDSDKVDKNRDENVENTTEGGTAKKVKASEDEAPKNSLKKQGKKTTSRIELSSETPTEEPRVDPDIMLLYTKTLHKKVYALMEEMVGSLADLVEETTEKK